MGREEGCGVIQQERHRRANVTLSAAGRSTGCDAGTIPAKDHPDAEGNCHPLRVHECFPHDSAERQTSGRSAPKLHGRFSGTLGRRYARRRYHRIQRQDMARRDGYFPFGRPAHYGTLYAGGQGSNQLRSDDGRPQSLYQALDPAVDVHAARGYAPGGIRLRREQCRPGKLREAPERRCQDRQIALSLWETARRHTLHTDQIGFHSRADRADDPVHVGFSTFGSSFAIFDPCTTMLVLRWTPPLPSSTVPTRIVMERSCGTTIPIDTTAMMLTVTIIEIVRIYLLDGVMSDPESAFCRHATQLFKHTIPVNLGAVTV